MMRKQIGGLILSYLWNENMDEQLCEDFHQAIAPYLSAEDDTNFAAIHTRWIPGPPTDPTQHVVRFYGFRKREHGGECVTTSS